jgi:hypothetical protein
LLLFLQVTELVVSSGELGVTAKGVRWVDSVQPSATRGTGADRQQQQADGQSQEEPQQQQQREHHKPLGPKASAVHFMAADVVVLAAGVGVPSLAEQVGGFKVPLLHKPAAILMTQPLDPGLLQHMIIADTVFMLQVGACIAAQPIVRCAAIRGTAIKMHDSLM